MKCKRILSLALAVCMAFGSAALLPEGIFETGSTITASAAQSGDYEYKVLKDGTAEITKYNGNGGAVTIPSTLGGKKVTSIYDRAFQCCRSLTSVTIPSSVEEIGDCAFNLCTSLKSVTILGSVKCIGNSVFSACESLKSVTIPNSVISIGDEAFWFCTSLTSVTIPKNVTSIGEKAFYCTSLTSITIPSSVKSIGDGAFSNCLSLESVTIPNGVNSIGIYTFYGCSKLKTITIPCSVTSIGDHAFDGCDRISDLYFIGTVRQWNNITIGNYNSCLSAANIHFKTDSYKGFKIGRDNNGYYHSRDAKIKKAGFVGRTDHMFTSADYYNELTKNSSEYEKYAILKRMSENWKGSCYGIALSIGLVNSRLVSISDISDKKPSTYYKLNPRQTKDKKFSNMIEYYYLSQFLEKGGSSAIIGQTFSNGLTNWLNGYDKLDSLLKKTVNIAKKNKPFLLSYGYNSSGEPVGHTVVALGCEKVGDKYNIIVYDGNDPAEVNYEYLSINDDYSGFSFSTNGVNNSNFNYIQIADFNKMKDTPVLSSNVKNLGKSNVNATISSEKNIASSIDSSSAKDDNIIISFETDSAFTITNTRGNKLVYNKGDFSGDIKVQSINVYLTNDKPSYSIEIKNDPKLIIDNNGSGLDLEIMNKDKFYSFSSQKSKKVVLTTNKEINITGDNIDFVAEVGVVDGETPALVTVSGVSDKSLSIDLTAEQPVLSTEKNIKDVDLTSVTATSKSSKKYSTISKGFIAKTENNTIKAIKHESHKWSNWTTTKKATCTADGEQTRTCSVCKKTEKKTLAKTGHKWSAWKTTGYNFSKKTSTQTRKCSACGNKETQTTKNAITRLAGSNRYETASVISTKMFKTAKTVIIATGMTFHDAMVAVPLANAYNAPLLLATEKHITAQTEAELKRLGAKNVIVVSTNGAIGDKAKAEFKAKKLNMTYIEGKTCFETAAKVAKALQTKTKTAPDTIFFATDSAFADALSASPVAAIKGAPIMYLKNTDSIDKATADYLKSVKGKVKNAYIIGGDGVISNAMMKKVANALGLTVNKTVVRVAGKNRYETCVAVNNKFKSTLSGDGICVAKGLDFPDALAGGVYAAATKQALFLADGKKLQNCQNTYLKSKNAGKITIFGGTGAVPYELVKLIAKASI